jgi:O-antigen/teichoic acid export membrane protein
MSDSHLKNFSYVVVNRISTTGLHGVFWLIVATMLKPELFGELSYIIALVSIFVLVSNFGANQSIVVFQAKQNHLVSNGINSLFVITTFISALVLLTINEFAALVSLGFSFFAMNQSNLLGKRQYKKFMWTGLVKGIIFLVLPISLYHVFDMTGILLGMAIGDILCSIFFWKSLKFTRESFSSLKNNYKVLIHNFANEANNILPRVADKLLIVPLFGFVLTGIYQFNLQILFALEAIPITLYSYLLPEESSGRKHNKLIYYSILVSILSAVIMIVASPIVIPILFPAYVEGIFSLQLLLITIIPLNISYIYNVKLQSNTSITIGFSLFIRMGSLLILIFLLGDLYGLVGLSVAFLVSAILNTIFLSILYQISRH